MSKDDTQRRRRAWGPWIFAAAITALAGLAAYNSVLGTTTSADQSTTDSRYQALYRDDVALRAEVAALRAQLTARGITPAGAAAAPTPTTTPPPSASRVAPAPRAASSSTTTTRPAPASSTTTTTRPPPPPCSVSVPGACIRAP